MKKTLFALFVVLASPLFAQGWVAQTSGTEHNLNSVFFTDPSTGWTVGGAFGIVTIVHTSDGGSTWVEQTSTSDWGLNSVFFIDASTGWAVGGEAFPGANSILNTTDGGTTWVEQTSGATFSLREVFFVDALTGWVVGGGGTILHTTNGGDTWIAQSSGTPQWLRSVFFADTSTGWVIGDDGTIIHTTNGGISWAAQSSGIDNNLSFVFFADMTMGWVAVNNGTVLRTTDGGISWVPHSTGTTEALHTVFFADAATGWVTGNDGTLFHTTDGGITWIQQTSGTSENLYSIHFADGALGWAVGAFGLILHTTTGGTGIEPPPSPTLSSPPDNSSVSTNPALIWNSSPGATWYNLQVSLSPYFVTKVVNRSYLAESSYELSNLAEDMTYYWRVSVKDDSGTSRWSERWSFSTSADPLAQFGVCYGSTGDAEPNNPGALIAIDPLTGAGTLVGPTGIMGDNGPSVRALAIKSTGEMYALSHKAISDLYTVNASSGAGVFVVKTDLAYPGDIVFDQNDVLYAVDQTNTLFTLDETTGTANAIGLTGVSLAGLAYDPTSGILYGSSGSTDLVYTINTTTGGAVLLGSTGLGVGTPDIHFDQDGNLFGAVRGAGNIYDYVAIDKLTGTGTVIGSTGFYAVVGLATRLEYTPDIPCEAISFFNAKCNSNGAAQAMVRLLNSTEYAGQTVEFELDGTPYPVTLMTNGTHTIGKLQVPQAGFGAHTIALVDPAGCYSPVNFNCQVGVGDDPEFDRLWNHFEVLTEESNIVPEETRLIGNYPNPFNPVTTIRYSLAYPGHVTITVFDLLGNEIETLVSERQNEGPHSVQWDATGKPSGVYFYRFEAGEILETRKLVVLK